MTDSVVKYVCKQYVFSRPNGVFNIPNFRNRGLIPDSIEFDKSCEKILRDNVKEIKVISGTHIMYKGLSGAYFAHSLKISFAPFESEILNSNGRIQFSINSAIAAKDSAASTSVKPLCLTFTVHYKETFGEPKNAYCFANIEELYAKLREQTNPYKITFRPQNPIPGGFTLDLKFDIIEQEDSIYNILDKSMVQIVHANGAVIEWDFGIILDPIVREHFCSMVEIGLPNKNICPWPMNVIIYGAND